MFKTQLTSNLGRNISNVSRLASLRMVVIAATRLYSINRSIIPSNIQRYNSFQNLYRNFSTGSTLQHGHITKPKPGEELNITFVLKDGEQKTYEVAEGDTLLDIAQGHNLDMEGACGGSCACSTCHVIVDPDYYDAIPEASDEEDDMLDLAYGLTETSRLGCQVKMSKDIDGIRVALPQMTRNVSNNDFDN